MCPSSAALKFIFHSAIIFLKHQSHQTLAQNSSIACYYTQNHIKPLIGSNKKTSPSPCSHTSPTAAQLRSSSRELRLSKVLGSSPPQGLSTHYPLKHSSALYTATSNSFFIFGTFSKSFPSIKLNQTPS